MLECLGPAFQSKPDSVNRPFPSSLVPLFQSESKCETFQMKMSSSCMQFHFHANQSHFHKNGFALRLALKQRHKRTRKWPIKDWRGNCLTAGLSEVRLTWPKIRQNFDMGFGNFLSYIVCPSVLSSFLKLHKTLLVKNIFFHQKY